MKRQSHSETQNPAEYAGRKPIHAVPRTSRALGRRTTARSVLYDGWNVIAEYALTSTTETLIRERTWGTDLSGSLQGAGGVGGLLMVEEIGTTTSAYHYQYDGNGNVTEITDHTGAKVATYRYDAFGNTLVATGSYAATNRYRFSTKPLDNEIANAPLYYYAYRYYDPLKGRWPSRDPIGEMGGINLYGFVLNSPWNWIDILGGQPGAYHAPNWGMPDFSNYDLNPPVTPSPHDNITTNTEVGGTTNQTAWFDENYPSEVARGKREIIDKINKIIKRSCPGQRMQVPRVSEAGNATDTWLDGVSVGGFSFLVESGAPITWNGFKWSYEAEMVITDTVGFDRDDGPEEYVFALFFDWNLSVPKQIYRASWKIEGSGECICEFPYEEPE